MNPTPDASPLMLTVRVAALYHLTSGVAQITAPQYPDRTVQADAEAQRRACAAVRVENRMLQDKPEVDAVDTHRKALLLLFVYPERFGAVVIEPIPALPTA